MSPKRQGTLQHSLPSNRDPLACPGGVSAVGNGVPPGGQSSRALLRPAILKHGPWTKGVSFTRNRLERQTLGPSPSQSVNNRNLSHSSGGYRYEIKVLEGPCSL